MLCRLLLIPELPEDQQAAQFENAYKEFCLATGMPETINRAKIYWADILEDEAKDLPEPVKTAFLKEAARYRGK